jgi:hypothetical protein
MGMYTGLKFTAYLSPYGVQVIRLHGELRSLCRENRTLHEWDLLHACFPSPELKEFSGKERCCFIPNGGDPGGFWKEGRTSFSTLGGNRWDVLCGLKNYGGEIESFLRFLPLLLAEPCEVQTWYEEADEPTTTMIFPKDSRP